MSCGAIRAPSPLEETGWLSSPPKFICVGLTLAILGKLFFTAHLPFIFAASAWLIFSSGVILLNQHLQGTLFAKGARKLYAFISEVNSIPIKMVLFPLTFFRSTLSPTGSMGGRPILLINGYLSFGSTWLFHKMRLAAQGFGPIYTMNVGSGRSIDSYAQEIGGKAKEIQRETGRKDLILIGHSKGGLVSSHFATKYADQIDTCVTDLVTIGSPLSGTSAARIGWGLDAAEMTPEAPFHKELRERISKNQTTRFFHIGSKEDRIVPYQSAIFGGNRLRQMVLNDTGHVALLYSSRVADQICKWLKS